MTNQEVLIKLNKIKSPLVREMMVDSFNKMNSNEKKRFARRLTSFDKQLGNNLNFKAKAISAYVRSNMEVFHRENLSNRQMKELNPLIRNAIYTYLVDEADGNTFSISSNCAFNLAPYWEDCEYVNDNVAIDFDGEE